MWGGDPDSLMSTAGSEEEEGGVQGEGEWIDFE